jgi:amino acid adenylation domain-containing protein
MHIQQDSPHLSNDLLAEQSLSAILARYPLTHGQKALWFLQRLSTEGGANNCAFAGRIPIPLDIPAFERAVYRLSERHPILRTTFAAISENGREPVQCVHASPLAGCFELVDATGMSQAELNRRMKEAIYQRFDLERGPLLRALLFKLAEANHVFIPLMHHSITDMWSIAIFIHELGQFYTAEKNGVPLELKPIPATYEDHVRAQMEMLAGPEGERLWDFWRQELSGDLPVINLPSDRPRPPVYTYHGAGLSIRFGVEFTGKVGAIAKSQGADLMTLSLAVFQVLLHRYTGQEDIIVASPKACRSRKMVKVLGYFVNAVPIRATLQGNPRFSEFLKQVKQRSHSSFEHGEFPYSLLVERLNIPRDPSRTSLAQAVFAWQKTTRLVSKGISTFALNDEGSRLELEELVLESMVLPARVAPYEITLQMSEVDGELGATIEYNTDLYEAATINRMLAHLKALFESIIADPEQRVGDIPMLTNVERQQMLIEWNQTEAPFPDDHCIHQLFEAQVARTPDAPAIRFEGQSLSYRELNERANQLAHFLRGSGVGPDVLVGLCTESSPEMIVGMLGVLKAGGAYVPMDAAYPVERLRYMLEDAQTPILLTQSNLLESLPKGNARAICLDADWDAISRESANDPPCLTKSDGLAYVIYTSGSTGRPKGVMLAHRGLCNFISAFARKLELTPDDRVLQFASLSFDASVFEIFTALVSGAALYLVRREERVSPVELARFLRKQEISMALLPPSVLDQLSAEELPAFRKVLSGGEACTRQIVERWSPGRLFYNAYGPTEATVAPTCYQVKDPAALKEAVPIGQPISNTGAYIVNEQQQPVPVGVPGELYISGVGLACGYLNKPELTAEKFVELRLADQLSPRAIRVYKTGDLARFLPDGNIEFLGRIDHQVKIRGFRIELGEIEESLRCHPLVSEAVVVANEEASGQKRLIAYIVPRGASGPLANQLRAFLQESLPEFMTPSIFVELENLPVTANGKVDRQRLPAPPRAVSMSDAMPQTEIEQAIAEAWKEILDLERVGLDDNFFDLGGHSLLLAQVHARLQAVFGEELTIIELFKHPTIRSLAAHLGWAPERRSVVVEGQSRAEKQRAAIQRQEKQRQARWKIKR